MRVGLNQAITYSLVSKDHAKDFALQERPTISLLMPMSEAHATLRQSLLPHLIEATAYNVARKIKMLDYMKLVVYSLAMVKANFQMKLNI